MKKISSIIDWALKTFIAGACSVIVWVGISMGSDIIEIKVTLKGIETMIGEHERRLNDREQADKDLAARIYEVGRCCE